MEPHRPWTGSRASGRMKASLLAYGCFMSWSSNPIFASGLRGNIGALAAAEWFEGGASLHQWRGLVSKVSRAAPLLHAMNRLEVPPALDVPWFENDEALCRSLRHLGNNPGDARILDWMLQHPQVQAYARSVVDKPYPDWEAVGRADDTCQPMLWSVSTHSLPALSALLSLAPAGHTWACLASHRTQRGAGHEVGPLPHAARRGWVEGVARLLEAGASCQDGLLAIAGQSRQVEMVRYLLAQGADVHHRDGNGQTVLGRIGRHIQSQNSPALQSEERLQQWMTIAALIAAEGARFDVHDGKTARADTVRRIWEKALGPEVGRQFKEILAAQALERDLHASMPPVDAARVRHRL